VQKYTVVTIPSSAIRSVRTHGVKGGNVWVAVDYSSSTDPESSLTATFQGSTLRGSTRTEDPEAALSYVLELNNGVKSRSQ